MCPSLIEIGSKTAEKKLCTNKQTDRHYENNGHLAVNQLLLCVSAFPSDTRALQIIIQGRYTGPVPTPTTLAAPIGDALTTSQRRRHGNIDPCP